jgi:hypothetical protein
VLINSITHTMTYYYDEATETKYYENTFVLELCQQDGNTQEIDMCVFILYDAEDDLMYLYGSRKSKKHSKYPSFIKSFKSESHLYDFLSILMDFDKQYINTTVHNIKYMTNLDEFDDIVKNIDKHSELTGYDNIKMTKKYYKKHMSAIF